MPQVLVTRKIFPEAISLLDKAGVTYHHNFNDNPMTRAEIRARGDEIIGLVCLLTDIIDAGLMEALPNLKVIANVAVGYDNIDVASASERGIFVTNTPDVLTECTADLAFALLLAVARRVVEADQFMRVGLFKGWELFQPHLGVDVFGKTLGIVGLGRIGTAVARRGALGFGMKVLYTANSPRLDAEQEFDAEFVHFSRLLQESDFISIHVPLSSQTRHMFTLKEFEQMKPSAYLINTARGPVIKEDDLIQALENGLIKGAALDVFENEPLMHPGLVEMRDKVVVVPHIGSATVETRLRMATTAVNNVIAALRGNCPPNALNPEIW